MWIKIFFSKKIEKCKFRGEGEYRCIVDKFGGGKAFKNGSSTMQGEASWLPKI